MLVTTVCCDECDKPLNGEALFINDAPGGIVILVRKSYQSESIALLASKFPAYHTSCLLKAINDLITKKLKDLSE
jgi:hypothetical protein